MKKVNTVLSKGLDLLKGVKEIGGMKVATNSSPTSEVMLSSIDIGVGRITFHFGHKGCTISTLIETAKLMLEKKADTESQYVAKKLDSLLAFLKLGTKDREASQGVEEKHTCGDSSTHPDDHPEDVFFCKACMGVKGTSEK